MAGCAQPDRAAGRGLNTKPGGQSATTRALWCRGKLAASGESLAPESAGPVKLALRAFYMPAFGYPEAEIKIGLQSASAGVLQFSEYDMPPGWDRREVALSRQDIADILAALQKSQFWRLPFDSHNDAADGGPVLVEAAFSGWRHAAMQNGAPDIDLGILYTSLRDIAIRRTKDRPLNWWK